MRAKRTEVKFSDQKTFVEAASMTDRTTKRNGRSRTYDFSMKIELPTDVNAFEVGEEIRESAVAAIHRAVEKSLTKPKE